MAELLSAPVTEAFATADPRDAEVARMLLLLLRSLVDDLDNLQLLQVTVSDGVAFQVRATAGDLGKLIGKKGRTARAIRTILSGNAARNGRKYSLDIAQ